MKKLKTLKFVSFLAVVMTCFLLQGAERAALGSAPAQETRVKPVSLSKMLQVTALAKLQLVQPGELISLCDLTGQMYGAGKGRVVALGEDGKITKSFATTIEKPSISSHSGATLVIGDCGAKTLFLMNTESGKMNELLKLNAVRDTGQGQVPEGAMLQSGELMSVASNGRQVFVAMGAGFSSAIFKIDPGTRQIVGRSWAPGADPTAMAVHEGGLYVLVGNGKQVRKFTDGLEKSLDKIDLPVAEAKGLAIRKDEIRVLTDKAATVGRFKIPVSALSAATLRANIDSIRAQAVRPKLVKFKPIPLARRYAILICGDLAENFWGECFWNDTVWMYKTLLNNGYTEENIFVLYGDGVDYASANPKYQHPTTVTDFPANLAWVNKVLDGLKNGDAANGIPQMRTNDTLFVWTFDHGSGGVSAELCLRGGSITDTAFAAKLDAIPYASRAIFMQQCRSGGFIDNLRGAKTFISTACQANENAHPADTENEVYSGRDYSHGEYNYYIICALDRLNPAGGAVNADANGNGLVSSLEAHNWNVSHESRSETPMMDDSGGIGSTFQFKK